MEFGARALGNRSILADPRNLTMVRELNDQIKSRDFWMPFAPVIIEEREKDYLVNPKNISSPYMTIGFDTTELAIKDLICGLHQGDLTARPQILKRDENQDFYDLIKEFEKITGVGGLINTSFNLHGYPIVNTPNDAMYVFLNSDLKYLLMDNILVYDSKQ
jgi:carbamoyltransferase